MTDNHFLRVLQTLQKLLEQPLSSSDIASMHQISFRQVSRDLNECRHLGANIVSQRTDTGYVWNCVNAVSIRKAGLLARWIELEEQRSVV